jgi:hypothetical protein
MLVVSIQGPLPYIAFTLPLDQQNIYPIASRDPPHILRLGFSCREIVFIYLFIHFSISIDKRHRCPESRTFPIIRQCLTHVPPDLYKFVAFTFKKDSAPQVSK